MVENRRVGIKSRETYECPGGARADRWRTPTSSRSPSSATSHREKARLEPRYAELVYDGLWFSPLKQALDAFVDETPALRHRRGAPAARARPLLRDRPPQRPQSLYDYGLATYDAADTFRHADSEGFVRLWGLGVQTWAAAPGPSESRATPIES